METQPAPVRYFVRGRLINGEREVKSARAARSMVDRLDRKYGASAHSYRVVTTQEVK